VGRSRRRVRMGRGLIGFLPKMEKGGLGLSRK
jgi:hypothetical protein